MKVAIIGGGIGGLSASLFLKLIFPLWDIQLYEGMKRLGGRIYTATEGGLQYESGAGRIGLDHHYTMILLKRYGLDKNIIPITNTINIRKGAIVSGKETHDSPIKIVENLNNKYYRYTYENWSKIRNNTIVDLVNANNSKIIRYNFEYDSETRIAPAYISMNTILNIFRGKNGFGIVSGKGGLFQLVDSIEAELRKIGVHIFTDHSVSNISLQSTKKQTKYRLTIKSNSKTNKCGTHAGDTKRFLRTFDKVIITTNIHSIRQLLEPILRPSLMKILYGPEVITTQPLLRVYAKFPNKPGTHEAWFKDIPKTVTRMGIRYFIPISSENGLAMISYTDCFIAKGWKEVIDNFGEDSATKLIMEQLKDIFPKYDIPNPTWVKYEYWTNGAHYWLPGEYDDKIKTGFGSPARMKPLGLGKKSGIYVGGEATSPAYQAWIEGGIERTAAIVNEIFYEESV